MKMQNKLLAVIVAALLLTPVLSAGQADKKMDCPRTVKVEAVALKGENFSEYAYFKNGIAPLTVELKTAVDGKVKAVQFKAGDEIKIGNVLLTLDAKALAKEIKEARAAAAASEKTLKIRKGLKVKNAKAEKQAEEKLRDARKKLAAVQAKADLYIIKSGIDGRIEKLDAEVGKDVAAGAVLAVVVNQDIMKFAIAGDEVSSLSNKGKIFVRFETLSSGMNGEVTIVGTNQAEISLDNTDRKLSAGVQASIKILKKEYSDVVVLIQQQVLQDGAGAYVYLAEKNRAKRATLTLGATENEGVLVLGGLEKGQILIVKGVECLQDGKKIKIVNKLPEKAEVKAEEKIVAKPEAAREEITAEPSTARAKWAKRFKVGLNLDYQYMTSEGFSGLYGRAIGPGLEFSFRFPNKFEFFLGAAYSGKSVPLGWAEGEQKYTMIPFSAGIKYYLVRKQKLEVFVGAGVLYILFKDTTPFDEIKENILGGSILWGGNYKLSDSFYATARLQFNLAKKTFDVPVTPDFPLDLTNVELKVGVFYTF